LRGGDGLRSRALSSQCASHVMPILHRPALRYLFSSEGSNSIPSPVKQIQAQQSKHVAYDDEDEWEVIAEYATNHQQAIVVHEIVDDIYRHAENFMHESYMVMQPEYVGKPEDLYLWCLIQVDWAVEDVLGVRVSDALLLQMRHLHTDYYRDKADPYAGNDQSA
jgi:hypothetical protein